VPSQGSGVVLPGRSQSWACTVNIMYCAEDSKWTCGSTGGSPLGNPGLEKSALIGCMNTRVATNWSRVTFLLSSRRHATQTCTCTCGKGFKPSAQVAKFSAHLALPLWMLLLFDALMGIAGPCCRDRCCHPGCGLHVQQDGQHLGAGLLPLPQQCCCHVAAEELYRSAAKLVLPPQPHWGLLISCKPLIAASASPSA